MFMFKAASCFILAAFISLFHRSSGFFFNKYSGKVWEDENNTIIENFTINYINHVNGGDDFPSEFYVEFYKFNALFRFSFIRSVTHYKNFENVFVFNSGDLSKVDYPQAEKYEHYRQKDGLGQATLIENFLKNGKHRFRMIGTLYDAGTTNLAFDIVPLMSEENGSRKKRHSYFGDHSDLFDSDNNHHFITRRSIDQQNLPLFDVNDFIIPPDPINPNNFPKLPDINKNGLGKAVVKPINLYVELLSVIDLTNIQQFQYYTGIMNLTVLCPYIKIYYAHVIKMTNQRFSYSLTNDPDLRVTVLYKSLVLLTNASDQTWLQSNRTYYDKGVVDAVPTLNAFKNFVQTSSLTTKIAFDACVLFFNKKIWNPNYPNNNYEGGFANLSTICTENRYALVEETGYGSFFWLAHVLGHMFGSVNDGDPPATNCGDHTNKYYIMFYEYGITGYLDFFTFSNCSIDQFKSLMLSSTLDAVSSAASCLVNNILPQNLPIESTYALSTYAGQIWTASDQCKMTFGPLSSVNRRWRGSYFCYWLLCDSNLMIGMPFDGTSCAPGKICLNGQCIESSVAPVTSCVNEDNVISQYVAQQSFPGLTFLSSNMTCDYLLSFIASNGLSPFYACSNPYITISSDCCFACLKYNAFGCRDYLPECPIYGKLCADGFLNTTLLNIFGPKSMVPIKQLCPYTCNTCTGLAKPLRCSNSTFLCQNGGTCVNSSTVTGNGLWGSKCICPPGYTGEICEIKTPCTPNPCLNNGSCQLLGSRGYYCVCPPQYTDYNCSTLVTTTKPAPTTIIPRTTTCSCTCG